MTGPGVPKPIPRTKQQTKRLFSNDKIKVLTKIKVQEYIESFFNKLGENHDLLSIVSPRFITYNTDKSFDPRVDPTQRQIQIARYFNELKSVLPSILIVDGGIIPIPHNIGQISGNYIENGVWNGFYQIFRKVPLVILAAARDVESADEMSGVISLMFNELRNLAGGHYITGKPEEAETWVVTLPNEPVETGPLTETDVSGDPTDRIWHTETLVEVFFEDTLAVSQELPIIRDMKYDVDKKAEREPTITVPDQISVNEQVVVFVDNFKDHYRIELNNPKVATLSYNMILTPRGFGKVTIRVVNDRFLPDSDKRIVAEKEIEVV